MSQTAVARVVTARRSSGILDVLKSPRFARLCSLLFFFAAWQWLIPLLETQLIPKPAAVLTFMWNEARGDTIGPYTVWETFAVSLQRLGIGLLIAVAIGTPIGILMGLFRKVEAGLRDFVVVGLAFPSLVWALLTGMWFGFGNTAPIVTVVLAAVTFVIINVAEGVKDVPKDLLDMADSYGVSRNHKIRHVIFPSLMPFFFASLRYGIANGWKGLVLAEVWAATNGAGWMIRYWFDARRPSGVIGYALYFVIFALIIERLIFGRLSKRVFRWRPSVVVTKAEA